MATIVLTVLITIAVFNIIVFIVDRVNHIYTEWVSMAFVALVAYGITHPIYRYIYKPLRLKYINKYYNSYFLFYKNRKGVVTKSLGVFFMKGKYEKYCYHKDDDSQQWIEYNPDKIEMTYIKKSAILNKRRLKRKKFYKSNARTR